MRLKFCLLILLLSPQPSWAFLGGIISGAKAVADQAHQKVIENQLIQLVIEAKKNYDASVRIYQEVRRLNEGRGLVRNVTSDLGQKARGMADEQKEAFISDFTYRGDSGIDRGLQSLDRNIRKGIQEKGIGAVDRYGNAVNKKTAAYVRSFKDQAEELWKRKKRGEAAREEGIKIAQAAKDMDVKTLGLELQAYSDTAEALNELVKIEMMREAQGKRKEIMADKEIASALNFLADREGMANSLKESFYLVRLSRAPALFSETRKAVSRLVSMLLALFLAGGLLYEFAKNGRPTGGFIPEVLGIPLILVIFGLVFYDKALVSFAVMMDAMEQTISPGDALVNHTLSLSSNFMVSPLNLLNADYWMQYLCLLLGFLSWAVSIVFLWVRFALFCLLYAVGPIFIVMALFEPLRKTCYGWMMAVLHVGLWGIFMRILSLVVTTSGISAFADPSGGIVKSVFASLVVNLVFLALGILCPYFTHLIVGGHIGEKAPGVLNLAKGAAR